MKRHFKCSLDEQQCGETCHGNIDLKMKCEFCTVTEQKDIGVPQPEAKIANLWIAVMMNEMKPRSVIPIVKKAFIGGFQSRDKEITSLRAENERLKKQIEWLEKEYQNKAH